MIRVGKWVRFRLTADGRASLSGFVAATDDLVALVLAQDELGVWILADEPARSSGSTVQTALWKWDHFLSALTDYEPEHPLERPPAGFRPGE